MLPQKFIGQWHFQEGNKSTTGFCIKGYDPSTQIIKYYLGQELPRSAILHHLHLQEVK